LLLTNDCKQSFPVSKFCKIITILCWLKDV
jgi:hypothetical protein